MKKYKILFADLDGTLIKAKSGETFPKGIWDMEFRFEVLDAIKKMQPDYVLIVSNQGGIENGFVDADNFRSKIEYIAKAISEYCFCECYCEYCEMNDKSNIYRKPNVGMLEYLIREYVLGYDYDTIKLTSLMIGDASGKDGQFSDTDKKTAENFGCDYLDVDDFIRKIYQAKEM